MIFCIISKISSICFKCNNHQSSLNTNLLINIPVVLGNFNWLSFKNYFDSFIFLIIWNQIACFFFFRTIGGPLMICSMQHLPKEISLNMFLKYILRTIKIHINKKRFQFYLYTCSFSLFVLYSRSEYYIIQTKKRLMCFAFNVTNLYLLIGFGTCCG